MKEAVRGDKGLPTRDPRGVLVDLPDLGDAGLDWDLELLGLAALAAMTASSRLSLGPLPLSLLPPYSLPRLDWALTGPGDWACRWSHISPTGDTINC